MPTVLDARGRLVGAGLVFLVLVLVEVAAPGLFVPLVTLALIAAPFVNWVAFLRIRHKRLKRAMADLPQIRSLRTAYFASLFLAIATTSLAGLGVFTAFRALHLIDAIPTSVFLVLLSYPCLLMTGPAVEWILLVDGE